MSSSESDDLLAPDESTSDYGESIESDTTSLKSEILQFQFENGRRYHGTSSSYAIPNDEKEQDRLDLYHHMLLLLLDGKLTYAPLDKPQRILDVGTGTGIWALDIAGEYPEAEVIGTDVTPIQPAWVLPNCRFEIDDLHLEWTWKPNYFDFIHSRNMAQAVKDWDHYMKEIYRTLRPGGYIEFVEARCEVQSDDNTVPENARAAEYFKLFAEAMTKLGFKNYAGEDYVKLLREAGFTEIQWHKKKQPWSPWPADKKMKYVGRIGMMALETAFESYILALLTRVLGWEAARAKELCEDVLKEVRDRKQHQYNYLDIIVARKPTVDEEFAT